MPVLIIALEEVAKAVGWRGLGEGESDEVQETAQGPYNYTDKEVVCHEWHRHSGRETANMQARYAEA